MDTKPTILIVDDVPANLFALERALGSIDCAVIKADSGQEALNALLDHTVALIVLDVRMPDMDGVETAELIRGTKRTQTIPIIFTTGQDKDQKIHFKGYDTAPVDFIYKPINLDVLLPKVAELLEKTVISDR